MTRDPRFSLSPLVITPVADEAGGRRAEIRCELVVAAQGAHFESLAALFRGWQTPVRQALTSAFVQVFGRRR
jgi:hypothetical protein